MNLSLKSFLVFFCWLKFLVKSDYETECNYIFLDFVYATDLCLERENIGLSYSDILECNKEENTVRLLRYYNSNCEGTPGIIYDINGIADLFGLHPSMITWKCDGTKSPSECSIRYRVYDVPATDVTCTGNEYEDYALATNVCAYSSVRNISFVFSCSNNNLTFHAFQNPTCQYNPHITQSFVSSCQQLNGTGPVQKLQVTCQASKLFTTSFIFVFLSLIFFNALH